ncbi:MAG: PhzF family phenazine biosynthesis protein [Bacteroidota bacterium]
MQLPIYQVDAFADTLFTGNPAAVCPLNSWLSDAQMQSIATENNLSETAFFVPEANHLHIRWFTPGAEVDLCGHATLATAHVLYTELGWDKSEIHFHCRKGTLRVQKTATGYAMDFPADTAIPTDIPVLVEQALGVRPLAFFHGSDDYLAILENEEQVQNLQPDFRLVGKLKARGLLVSAIGDQHDFVSRGFFPQVGIDEDPVTGSAHTLLTPYWAQRLGKNKLQARQISARGGTLSCTLQNDRVILEGTAQTYLKGTIYI